MTACPARDELEQLLRGELAPARADAIDRHLEACSSCGARLADWTDTAASRRWRELLGASASDWKPEVPAALPPSPPPEIPGFEILQSLGRGGAATVYLARQTSLNRLVALKLLRAGPEWNDAQRLRIEAESAAQLRHPHIVVVYEIGDAGGHAFLTMEYVDGGTLADLAARQPLPARQAASLLEPVARALHFAHQAGIIHRDVKPSNILLQKSDSGTTPKVADFGLARRLDRESGLTQTQDLLGTPMYMAPELVKDAANASPRSDVYAVGVVLYELLTGRPPFVGRSPLDTLLQARDQEPVPPRRLQHDVPRDLQTVCLKCLEKEPERRYSSAGELGDDLARYLRDEPVMARPVSGAEQAWRWARRHRALAASLASLAFLLVAAMIAAIVVAGHFRRTAGDMERLAGEKDDERGHAVRARESAELSREEALRTLYFTQANLTGQSLTRDDGPQVIDHFLREWRGRPLNPDPRGWEWNLFQSVADHSERTLHGHSIDALAVAWSPDGTRIASGGFDRTLRLWDAATGRQLRAATAGYGITQLGWHPDGRRILLTLADGSCHQHATTTGDELGRVTNPDFTLAWNASADRLLAARGTKLILRDFDGNALQEFDAHTESIDRAAFATDGRIASSDRSGRVIVWNPATGQPLWDSRLPRPAAIRYSPFLKWSPDSRTLAASFSDGAVWLRDAETGKLRHELDGHRSMVRCVHFSPDNRWLATCSFDRTAIVWDLATGRRHRTLVGHTHAVMCVAFHPDSTRLASSSGNWNGVVKLWNLDNHDVPRRLREEPLQIHTAGSGPQILAATAEKFQLLDSQTAKPIRTIPLRPPPWPGACTDCEGKHVAGRDGSGALAVRSVETGALVATLPLPAGAPFRIAVSPRAERIAITTPQPTDTTRRRVQVFDVATGAMVKELVGNGTAWSPDGRFLAIGGVYTIELWDARTWERHSAWESTDVFNNLLRFSPDSRRLAYAADSTIHIHDSDTGTPRGAAIRHASGVLDFTWNPDGTRLATVSEDALRLWDSATGQFILSLRDGKPMSSAAWSRDGERLWVGGAGGLRGWNASRGYAATKLPEPTASRLHGWWTTEPEEGKPLPADPFSQHPPPQWFGPADDPNGFLPLANRSAIYWTRLTITEPGEYRLRISGPIECQILHRGQPLPGAPETTVRLEPGTHALGLRIIEPDRQSGLLMRPGAGLFFRMDKD